MRFILTILMLNSLIAFGQDKNGHPCESQIDTLTKLEVFKVVDKMPTIAGGMQALYKEISKKIKYPHLNEYPIESKVIVAFIVDTKGQVKGKRIIRNIKGTDLGEQLLKIIDDFKWQPGSCNGKTVSTLQLVPMVIDLK